MINGKDKVSWIMKDEKILKLEKLDKTYEISDTVFRFMESKKLLEIEDFEVEVEIVDTKGENGTITNLVPLGVKEEPKHETKQEKEEEPKPEKVTPDNVITKQLTVGGVAVDKKGIIFKEEDGVWYTLADDIDAGDVKKNATRKMVEIVVSPQEKGNAIITKLTVLKENVKPEKEESSNKSTGNNTTKSSYASTQASIEAQVAVEHSQILAGKLFPGTSYQSEQLDDFIEQRARKNYALIQELKNL